MRPSESANALKRELESARSELCLMYEAFSRATNRRGSD